MVAAREVIERAKGALSAIYGISAEQAFAVLRWRSQETNTKLRVLAEKLVVGWPPSVAPTPAPAPVSITCC